MTHAPPTGSESGRAGAGPLQGLTVVELAGIGPGPYAAMLLADMGARVIRIDRPGGSGTAVDPLVDVLSRNRRSVAIDLRRPEGVAVVETLVRNADVLIEGFRPGVTERLGLGPDRLLDLNPRLVYGRMTGWGQAGPLARTAGHDIGYIAITGALGAIGRPGEAPVPPLNLVGDFAGGSLFLVAGILAAVWEAGRSGRGQVVDAAIVDGVSSMTGILHALMASGQWRDERGVNLLDGGVPWYDTYETADGQWMAVGAIETKFYKQFVALLDLPAGVTARENPTTWPALREAITAAFRRRSQQEWTELFDGTDACVSPVLSLHGAPGHPHLSARSTFVTVNGLTQPAPAPRFTRTPTATPEPPVAPGTHTRSVLAEVGITDVDGLVADGVVHQA